MEHISNLSYTITFGAEYLKYNIYLQSLKSIVFKISKFLYPAISEINGNNITLSSMSSYNCIARLIAPLVSSNSSYAYICILQQNIHMSLLHDHLNVIC